MDLHATLARCENDGDPGWYVELALGLLTAPFLRWGQETGPDRHLYLVADDLFRLTINAEPEMVLPAQGPAVPAVVLKEIELIARSEAGALAMADFDVSYRDLGGGNHEDAYAIYMSALAAWPLPLYIEAGMYLVDLTDCDPTCEADEGIQFCCKTAFLVDGDTVYPDVPTNPALTDDGAWMAFNRFTSWQECTLCAQVHILKNPFEDAAVFSQYCVENGLYDGFHEPIDCSAMMMDGDEVDEARCPNVHCCDEPGVDCNTCVTIGERSDEAPACDYVADGLRERNYLAFFELDDTRYLSFRSTDLMGDQQQDMHIYEVGTAPDGEFVVPTEDAGYPQVVPVAGFPGSDLTLFGPAPFRTLFEPGEDPCEAGDDDDDSAGDDDDATDDDDDDTGIPPGPGCRCRSSLAPPVAGSSLAAALLALVAFRRVRR